MSLSLLRVSIVALVVAAVSPGLVHAEDAEGAYPIELFDRPFTLPTGVWQAGLDVFADKSFDAVGTAIRGDYGLTNQLQLGLQYTFGVKEFEAKGDLALQGNYVYLETNTFYGMAVASTGYSFLGEALSPLELGSLFWYTIVPSKIAVYTIPTVSIALADQGVDGGASIRPVFLSLPLSVAVQLIKNVYVEVGTELASIKIADSDTIIFGADYVPLSLIGFFSLNNALDLAAGLSWGDLKADSGAIDLTFLVRYRGF